MSDLVENRIEHALSISRRSDSMSFRETLNGCGRPLNIKFENGALPVIGTEILPDGSERERLMFVYKAGRTTKNPNCAKDACRFHVDVEASLDGKYVIRGFGCVHPLP